MGTSQATAGVQSSALERNVARLFSERVRFSGRVEFTRSSVLAGVARLGLKSMVEGVRLQTLGRAGLQQLQLDVHYLRQPLSRSAFPPSSSATSSFPLPLPALLTALCWPVM